MFVMHQLFAEELHVHLMCCMTAVKMREIPATALKTEVASVPVEANQVQDGELMLVTFLSLFCLL